MPPLVSDVEYALRVPLSSVLTYDAFARVSENAVVRLEKDAARPTNVRKKDGTDGRTDECQIETLRFPLDAASVLTARSRGKRVEAEICDQNRIVYA